VRQIAVLLVGMCIVLTAFPVNARIGGVLLLAVWSAYRFFSKKAPSGDFVHAGGSPVSTSHKAHEEPTNSMNSSSGSYDDDEPLVSVAVTDTAGFAGHPIKGPGSGAMSVARWIQPGETVEIGDISIPGGFFYLGQVLRSHPKSVDACVVDARAHVARESANPTHGLGSIELSYGSLTSEQRRTYLEWLGSERKKSDINIGYLFFHLYGFERRILIDGAAGRVSEAEYGDIGQELRRLLNIDVNYSWQRHVRNLLETVDLMMGRAGKMYEQTAPNGLPSGYQVPMNVRVAFGQAAVDKRPVPASWALAWVKLDPMMIRRAAVTRCPEEFDRVFVRKYGERFKSGMLLPANRTLLDARPQPAFSALTNMPVPGFLIGLPDIAAITGPRNKLQLLMNESVAALDSYSRYLGRKPEAKGTLDAALRLPTELWPESTRQEIKLLADEVEGGTRVTTFGQILLRFKSTGTLTRDNAAAFSVALGQAGIAVEPDVRLGARTPKLEDVVALFPATPSVAVSPVDDAYNVSTLMIDLAASIAMADGTASEAAISVIDGQVDTWSHLSIQQRARLKARNRVQLAHPGSAVGLKKKLAALPSNDKQTIASFLMQTANADGVVSREKVRLLEKVYRMLDIDAQRLYTDLHQGAGGQSTQSAVQPRMIKHESSAVGGFVLDASRIQALKQETARVSAILADVFIEESPAQLSSPAPQEPDKASYAHAVLPGLDDVHSTFLRVLISRPAWTRAELSDAASNLDLMLDGAIEQVNEASLDHWDEPLTDGDDPVEINQDLAQRLAA
jgi:hypothetical protein